MEFENGNIAQALNAPGRQVQPGLGAVGSGEPVMTTPATVVTTPEDVALTTAALNAAAAAANYAHATHS